MHSVQRWGPGSRANVASNLPRFSRWAKRLVDAIKARKRTEITIETDQVLIIHRRQVSRAWCDECGCEVDAVGLEEAGVLSKRLRPRLPGCIGPEDWHVCEGPGGAPLICVKSLLKSM